MKSSAFWCELRYKIEGYFFIAHQAVKNKISIEILLTFRSKQQKFSGLLAICKSLTGSETKLWLVADMPKVVRRAGKAAQIV